jgi:hypothetical protein
MITSTVSTLPLYKFKINIQATSPITFYNFPGIAFRGGFGWMLKLQTCIDKARTSCKGCQFIQYCPYASIFESHNLGNTEIMKEASNFPHPFVMSPVVDWPGIVQAGEMFTVYISIFGEAIKYFHFFVKALKTLGQKGLGKQKSTFMIDKIYNYHNGEELYTSNKGYIAKDIVGLTLNDEEDQEMQIHFLTPCQLKSQGTIEKEPDIKSIIKNILRRYKIISYIYADATVIYTDIDCDLNTVEVTDVHTRWYSTDRFSKRQERTMRIMGFTGSMKIKNCDKSIYNILKIGQTIHIGKHTSFGCGLIQVDKIN